MHRRFLPVGAGFNVEFKAEEGALLFLPDGASRERLLNVGSLKSMAEAHAPQWYNFARSLGRERCASLNIITGCDKTSMFAMLTFSGASRSAGISALVSAAGLVDGKVSWDFSSVDYHSFDSRVGPTQQSLTRNQCVFFRSFVLARPGKGLLKWFGNQTSLLPRQFDSRLHGSMSGRGRDSTSPSALDQEFPNSKFGASSSDNTGNIGPDTSEGMQVISRLHYAEDVVLRCV